MEGSDARYLRQIMLAGVGPAGQARIARSPAPVAGPTLAHEVAARYATGAGFARVTPGPIDVDELAPASILVHGAARDVLAGARAALATMRAALEGKGS